MVQEDTQYSYTDTSIEGAEDLFIDTKDVLLDVNKWQDIVKLPGMHFSLINNQKIGVTRPAHKGDYIKIEQNELVQWLHIESILYDDYPDENKECLVMQLMPYIQPGEKMKNNIHPVLINIIIERINNKLICFKHEQNTYNTDNQSDNLFLTNTIWDSLLKALINFN
jgi:hypothetical protein